MSEYWLIFIPTDPNFKPTEKSLEEAQQLFESYFPRQVDDTNVEISDEIELIHPAENWSGVFCPQCNKNLEEFFFKAVDAVHKSKFDNLNVVLPCCKMTISLNDLHFPWPAGFARFKMEVRDPDELDLSPKQKHDLEVALGHSLRTIWMHI